MSALRYPDRTMRRGRHREETRREKRRRLIAASKHLTETSQDDTAPHSANVIRKARAVSAGATILWGTPVLYVQQLIFWFFSIIGLTVESIWFAGWALPGTEFFLLFYLLTSLFGMLNMLFATAVFIFQRVDCFSGEKLLIFMACFAGCFVLLLNLFPFVVIWVLWVMSHQEVKEKRADM